MGKKSKYYKHKEYGHVYINNEALSTPIVRVAWPALNKPRADQEYKGKTVTGKYELVFILPKKNQDCKNLNKAVQVMTKGMLELYNKGNPAKLSSCDSFKDGDEFDHEKYPYYKKSWILLARYPTQPSIIGTKKDKDGKFVKIDPKLIQGGCECRGIVSPIVGAKGISFQLISVQLVNDDGTRYGGGMPSPESFHNLFEGGASDDEDTDDDASESDDDDSSEEETDDAEDTDSDDDDSADDEESEEDSDDDDSDEEGSDESEDEDSEEDSDDDEGDDEDSEDSEDEDEDEKPKKAARGRPSTKSAPVVAAKGKKKKGKELALDQI